MERIARVVLVIGVVAALAVVGVGCSSSPGFGKKETAAAPQTNCPVMGGRVNKQVYADYQGKRVYFCCPKCKATFQKDPAKYLKKLAEAGVEVAKTPSEK